MGFSNLLKAEYSGWLRLVAAGRHLFGDGLKRNVRERETRRAKHEAAEKRQINSAAHLQEGVEIGDGVETTEPAGQAGATTPAQHREGIENGAVAHEIKDRIDLLRFSDTL